mgnify:CR=1 FL=1
MEQWRFPIGDFQAPGTEVDAAQRQRWIDELAQIPDGLRRAVAGLSDEQLDTPYRPNGWTLRQVAHHLADASLNHYIRFKLALTENAPAIKPFEETEWAKLPDSRLPLGPSLELTAGVTERWVAILRALSEADFARTFVHPASGPWTLDKALAFSSWHGRHHTAQIVSLRERKGW